VTFFWRQNRRRGANELDLTFGVVTSVLLLAKIDQEMRPWECAQTWHTHRDKLNLGLQSVTCCMLAIARPMAGQIDNKRLSCRRGTARRSVSVEIFENCCTTICEVAWERFDIAAEVTFTLLDRWHIISPLSFHCNFLHLVPFSKILSLIYENERDHVTPNMPHSMVFYHDHCTVFATLYV